MSITIKLDTPAMNTLFPEGSEARVELQKAVLANFCASALKPSWLGEAVTRTVAIAKDAAIREVLSEIGIVQKYGSLTIPDSLRLRFKDEARSAVHECVAPLIKEAVLERTATLGDGVRFEVSRMVDAKIDAEINEAVRLK